MTRFAVSGHRGLDTETGRLVDAAIRGRLADAGSDLVGVSCLADGADQIFALAVLDVGDVLEVIVPASRYRDGLPPRCHADYDALLADASRVWRSDHTPHRPRVVVVSHPIVRWAAKPGLALHRRDRYWA